MEDFETETKKKKKKKDKKSNNFLNSDGIQKAMSLGVTIFSNKDKYLQKATDIYRKVYNDSKKELTLDELKNDLSLIVRMSKAIGRGEYRDISPSNVFKLAAAIAYFSLGKDIIPDDIPGAGMVDDVMVIVWSLGGLIQEVKKFETWEASNPQINVRIA